MNALWSDLFFPMVIGISAVILAIGLSALRTRIVPVWMAWVGFLVVIALYTPAGFFAFLVAGLWTAVASFLIWRKEAARRVSRPSTTTTTDELRGAS